MNKTPEQMNFFDSLPSHLFLPHILQPARMGSNSKTLIDNIFSNAMSLSIMSGNITLSISDYPPQFIISTLLK